MENELLQRFPGVSCAWTDGAGRVQTACYGVADKEQRNPVDENSIFPACSIAKFVTALCVAKLHEQRKIDMDAPVNAYLRGWKLRTPEGSESDASIRALMSHTAGIVDGDDGFYGLRRDDPPVSLMDILEGRTRYNNRPTRAEKPQGEAFEYSDAGYCVLQLLVEEITGMAFADAAQSLVFDELGLRRAFFATPEKIRENSSAMVTGYDGQGLPIPGRFPVCPDLAASGLWTTPTELLAIARAFLAAIKGRGDFLQAQSARRMATPVERFPWTGLGVFMAGEDGLMSQGWGENGQCMLKMNISTGAVSVVMTNRNPEMDQSESGIEWLVNSKLGI